MNLPATAVLLLSATLAVAGCSTASAPATEKPPALGACRVLTPADVQHAANTTPTVPCTRRHTAQTFAVGTLPASTGSSYTDRRHGAWIHDRCETAFERFLGIDESLAMRIRLSWAWFRPTSASWAAGARWYRCDIVGGPATSTTGYRPLPTTAKALFSNTLPEQWLACARGTTLTGSTKVPCSEKHDWRAVTTIKLGGPKDPYPGDRLVEVRTRDYCSDSVEAWMNYPPDFEFGYTWTHAGEWQAGNRRSVCWARTSQ